MTGGLAYILDEDDTLIPKVNKEIVKIQRVVAPAGQLQLKNLIESHVEKTGSSRGAIILKEWDKYLPLFWQLVPPSEEDTPEASASYEPTSADKLAVKSRMDGRGGHDGRRPAGINLAGLVVLNAAKCYGKFSSRRTRVFSLQACIVSLQTCSENHQLSNGRAIHSRMIACGHRESPLSATSLINMYCKCFSIPDAISVFHESTHVHNVFIYNSIVAGLTFNDFSVEALEIYFRMRLAGVVPDNYTFPSVIKACSEIEDLKHIHGTVYKFGLDLDLFIGSALLRCYLEFEAMNDAVKVFEELPVRDDVVLWNSMINGYVQIGRFDTALMVFRRMMNAELTPSNFTVTGVLSALALACDVRNGKLLHAFALKMNYQSMVAVSNALIDMYGKCLHLADALSVFDGMLEKDMFSWNSIVSVHAQCDNQDGTLTLLREMLNSGFRIDLATATAALRACAYLAALMQGREIHGYMIRNGLDSPGETCIHNTIMDMYTKCGNIRAAQCVFNKMKIRDVASWNILVMGYGMHGLGNKALDLFFIMCDAGFKPDAISFTGVLSACSHSGFLRQGQELLESMLPKYGVSPAIEHYACIVDMLGRAGRIEEAWKLIESMVVEPNQVVWRAFLNACKLHGFEASRFAEIAALRVLELEPDHCGNYVLMSNMYGANGKYEQVAGLRHAMKQNDVKKSPGCSWIELSDGTAHAFFNGDRSHRENLSLYDGLNSLYSCFLEHDSSMEWCTVPTAV
ncbi:hypothetical protein M569_08930 [Genlisea aurea]|uniref:Pentatricopeptide repeat-containing protein n=1 Tax=Genlisea aurea TaxID=192259 RepID=S8CM73_9LAMI|nr:hypothetical protein M569_08930 [Genlisea aurea]